MNTRLIAARAAADLLERTGWHTVGRADVVAADGELTLSARIVPWSTPTRVTDDGRRFYTESWEPGSLVPDARVVLYDGHTPGAPDLGAGRGQRTVIGRVDGFTTEADGLYGMLHVADTARGRDVHALARTLGYVDVSLESDIGTPDADTIVRTAASPLALTGLAVILPPGRGAYPGAVATAARADGDQPDGDDDEDGDDDADGTPGDADTSGRASIAEVVRREMARYRGPSRGRAAANHPLARFTSFDQLHNAVVAARGDQAAELSGAFTASYHRHRQFEQAQATVVGRALVDQITADNPGLIPPAWLTTVFGIIDRGRAGITALGGPRSAGDSGMEVDWPYYDGDLTAIVAKQTAEKTAINSVKVSFKRGSVPLATYAGGSDVSFQLIRRSSPSYLALYERILQMAYGITTETAFDADLMVANPTPDITLDLTADTDGSATRAALFQASAQVAAATGAPATAVLAASDVFIALGGKAWLQAPQYGTQNVPGTTSAATLRINISGLEIVEAVGLADGNMIVTNPEAASWLEDGPFLVSADDVEKLGSNVAIWGMGATGTFLPAGIVRVAVSLVAADAARSSK